MYTLKQLKQIKNQIEDQRDLPIEDFLDWDFVESLIKSHIDVIESTQKFEQNT